MYNSLLATRRSVARPLINEQGLLGSNGHPQPKRRAQGRRKRTERVGTLRVGSLNVGAMTGKGREIADLMVRRKMNVLSVQESG